MNNEIVLHKQDGKLVTTSLDIAAKFGKRHGSVLRAIQSLDCSEEFTRHNFVVSEYKDRTGRTLKAYNITRDGFSFLCMGFTGPAAGHWKEKFIAAFNAMEAELLKKSTLVKSDKRTAFLPDIQNALTAIDQTLEDHDGRIKKLEGDELVSVYEYAADKGYRIPKADLENKSVELRKLAADLGVDTVLNRAKCPATRFPRSFLEKYFEVNGDLFDKVV